MQRQLIIVAGSETGRTFPLEDGQTLLIGRGQASDTKINDPHMSRVHCRVQVDGPKTVLVDDGSSSGTLIGTVKVTQHELQPGEVFKVGDTRIRFQLGDQQEEATLADNPLFGQRMPKPKVTPLKDLVGQSLAHYRLDSIIAQGNSGMVFKAHNTQKDRVAALKVLTPDPTHSEEQKERFVRAMKTMMPVQHPNIVQLYNAGKNGPYCWAAMQYVDGESLTDVIDRLGVEGMLDWRDVFRVAVHVGRALQEAYERKIIHRNVTPPNILRRHSDKACLLGDLMLAKALEGTLAKQVTQPGQLIGDVPYMSPERTRDQASVDHRSDIYGLGATCYALLTAQPPFEGNSLPELIRQVRGAEPRRPKEFQLSVNDLFQESVMRMIAKRPEDRYDTPADLLRDLDRIGRYNNVEADWGEWIG
ncbi:MAG: protein kinase [Pirellulaceae bacterium]